MVHGEISPARPIAEDLTGPETRNVRCADEQFRWATAISDACAERATAVANCSAMTTKTMLRSHGSRDCCSCATCECSLSVAIGDGASSYNISSNTGVVKAACITRLASRRAFGAALALPRHPLRRNWCSCFSSQALFCVGSFGTAARLGQRYGSIDHAVAACCAEECFSQHQRHIWNHGSFAIRAQPAALLGDCFDGDICKSSDATGCPAPTPHYLLSML